MSKACCFTGHRELPSDPAVIEVLREKLRSAVRRAIDDGFTAFYAGGAVGFDMLAAEAVIAQRNRHPEIRLIEAIPFPGHSRRFSETDQTRQKAIEALSDEVVYVSEGYHEGCFSMRNHYMVDRSERLIAYVHQLTGGSVSTLRYARDCGIETVLL